MKYLFIIAYSFILFLTENRNIDRADGKIDKDAYARVLDKKRLTTIYCSPDWSTFLLSKTDIEGMVPLPGTGTHTWKISTNSDSAQFYFNQGINLYYGFHIIEALPSFKKAQLFDSACAMLYWGEALAYGPNINDYGYAASPDALAATKKAKDFIKNTTDQEKGLIDAMQVHYSADISQKRVYLNQLYADKMKALYEKYSGDAEIGTLYADALMNQHPWDLWEHDGKAKAWTPQIITVLENVMKHTPDHPGANHYYIHTMEASPYAFKAIPSAERLGALAPGLSHIVHMPSHIYIRTGQYEKGINVNRDAVKTYYQYKTIFPEVGNNPYLYEYHNRHMQASCSINTNDYSQAIKDATDCRNSIDTSFLYLEAPIGNYIQYVYMTPALTMITFEKWSDILREPSMSDQYHFALLIQEFAKGMAYANTNDLNNARSCLHKMESVLSEPDMSVVFSPFNGPVTPGNVAKYILMGTIAENENRMTDAVNYYKKGVATEDSLVYQEPRDWLVPARHYLGTALLKQKKYRAAQKVFEKDLTFQPHNYISATGLEEALKRQ